MRKFLFLFISIFCFAQTGMANENVFSLSSYKFERGKTETIYVHLNQPEDFGGFQFNLYLPEGVSIVNKGKNKPKIYEDGPWGEIDATLSCIEQTDGSYMFLEYPAVGADMPEAGNGYIIEMNVETSPEAEIGTFKVAFRNTRFASLEDVTILYDDVEYDAEIVDYETGVEFNFDSDSVVTVYSVYGTLICKDKKWSEVADTLPKGIYIVSGKKIVVK